MTVQITVHRSAIQQAVRLMQMLIFPLNLHKVVLMF